MKPKSIRFGLDYVKNDMEVDPESLPEGLSGEGRLFYAELSKEQKAWNAQWYSEDHNDARRDQRRFFLMYLQHNFPAITQSLYQVLPSFKQIFAGGPDSSSMRFDFLQSMMMSFTHDYLKVSETRREEVDRIIEEIIKTSLVSKPNAPESVRPWEPDTSEWGGVILQQVHFKAMQRLLPHDAVLEEAEGSIDERFAIVYRPLYRWMARWHLLEPWVADVALSTLLKWDRLAVEQPRATSFALVPRPKTAQHNAITYNFPKLAAEDLAFSFSW